MKKHIYKTLPVFELTLLRHAESVGNVEDRIQGQSDYPLTAFGKDQANRLANRWLKEKKEFDYVISSPLSRAKETAQILTSRMKLPSLEYDDIWMEREMGKLSGMLRSELENRAFPFSTTNPFMSLDENQEGDWALYLRAGAALYSVLKRKPAKYLIVSHGAILNMVIYSILGLTPQNKQRSPRFNLPNTSFSSFQYFPKAHRWNVHVIGDNGHLEK
ncbi:MAG TPA: histidine phosphatase family protein [Anaerolineales bacterium]|nr:histidine phosphatase family protein [Anaerolineales bacterium]